jgi:hypothetical protein
MGTPKKPVKKSTGPKSGGAKKQEPADPKSKKRVFDDEDEDEDYDLSMDDDLGRYESFDGYEEDDDY